MFLLYRKRYEMSSSNSLNGICDDVAVVNGKDNQHKGTFFFGDRATATSNEP